VNDQWRLTLSDERRQQRLENAPTFEVIAKLIEEEMEVLCCHVDPCRDLPNQGFRRIIYCVRVAPYLLDLFFNSRTGYRGQHFLSPYKGLEANDFLLKSLTKSLIVSGARVMAFAESDKTIYESLTSPSAKAWLAEAGLRYCEQCDPEWSHPATDPIDISNGRWEYRSHLHAHWGRTAPYLTKIRFFGAFVNDRHDEFIPGHKRRRAWQIHDWGWS
jgi:hypothetical protein